MVGRVNKLNRFTYTVFTLQLADDQDGDDLHGNKRESRFTRESETSDPDKQRNEKIKVCDNYT